MPQTLTILLIVLGLLVVAGVALAAAFKLGLLKHSSSGEKAQPYRCCDRLLSEAECKFHTALTAALPILCQQASRYDAPLLFAKVRLGDVLAVDAEALNRIYGQHKSNVRYRRISLQNRINQKHVDFLLCNPATTKPVLVIELDDKSHQRPDRQERDKFLDDACSAARLPVLHVLCIAPSAVYDPRHIADSIASMLKV